MGFVIARNGGADAPWIAWREDGVKLRADTLRGVKSLVMEHVLKERKC